MEKPSLIELQRYPQMTRWFNPGLLIKLLWRVIIADVFGQYADRRLIAERDCDLGLKKNAHLFRVDVIVRRDNPSIELWARLPAGRYYIRVTAVDIAGNRAGSRVATLASFSMLLVLVRGAC